MSRINTADEAKRVVESAKTGSKAVFIIEGEVKIMSSLEIQFDKMLEDFSENFVGVYNSLAKLKDIQNDLSYCNLHLNKLQKGV